MRRQKLREGAMPVPVATIMCTLLGLLSSRRSALPTGPVIDLVPGLGVAEEVGADALLGRVVRLQLGAPVGG